MKANARMHQGSMCNQGLNICTCLLGGVQRSDGAKDGNTLLSVHQQRENINARHSQAQQPNGTGIRDEFNISDDRFAEQLAALQARINERLAASDNPNSLPVVIATAIEFIAEKLADVDVTVVDIDDEIEVADQDDGEQW